MNVPDYMVVVGGVVLYQAVVTVMVVRSPHFARPQKLSQLLFIWLLPLIGAVMVRIAINAANRSQARR